MNEQDISTFDHEEIRRWADSVGAKPTLLPNSQIIGGGTLSFRFPQSVEDSTAIEVSWTEFFEVFEERNLKLVYPSESKNLSAFRFVSRSHEP